MKTPIDRRRGILFPSGGDRFTGYQTAYMD